jgi:hypothetical protein
MTITRSMLLTMALAIAISPACNDRSTKQQSVVRPEQVPQATTEAHGTATERTPPATGTERASVTRRSRWPAAPELDHADPLKTPEGNAASPASQASARAAMNTPHARQLAPTEAELRQVTYQVQARMDAELARANDIIGELQKANAELRQTLAAERQQLAELRKRLMSGRSIALQ